MEVNMFPNNYDPYLLMVLQRDKEDYIEGLRKEKIVKGYVRSMHPKSNKPNILAWIRENMAHLVAVRIESISKSSESRSVESEEQSRWIVVLRR
jgi:hypothetical protein